MKRLAILGIVLILVVVLAVIITMDSRSLATREQIPYPHPANFTPSVQGKIALGHAPALRPPAQKLHANVLPTFGTADVEHYLLTDPTLGMDVARLKLTHTITFVSSQALSQQLGEDFTDDAPILCYIEFKGTKPFSLESVHTLAPMHFTKAYEVLDGRTGDQITWGAKH